MKRFDLRKGTRDESVETTGCVLVDGFSLVEGGTVHRIESWLGLAMPGQRTVIVAAILAAVIAWLPLFILTVLQGKVLDGARVPFLRDFTVSVRFLVSLPMLVAAGLIIGPRLKRAVQHFVTSGLVTSKGMPEFEDLVSQTLKLRYSVLPSVLLVALAWAPSFWVKGGDLLASGPSNWHRLGPAAGDPLSLAGWWFTLVSAPLYRLWLFRWIWITLVWAIFLARVSNLNLAWIPTHPDRAAGLAFLAQTEVYFGWIGFAASAPVAARFANMIAYEGQTVSGLKYLMMATSLLAIGVTLAPLLVLSPRLFKVKQKGLFEYGTLGTHYVQEFDEKWNVDKPPENEQLLGTADLQSLADLSNSFAVIGDMKIVLLDRQTLLWIAAPAILPMLVLVLVATPADDLIRTVLKLIA